MRNKNKAVIYLLVALVLQIMNGCGTESTPDVEQIEVSIDIQRWDQQLFQMQSKTEIAEFLHSHPLFAKQFLQVDQYPHDSLAVNYLNAFINNPGSSVLRQEVEAAFGDLSSLQHELQQAFKFLKYYYPEAAIPEVYTAVTGFAGNDLLVSDSAIVIGLDYYLGEEATYRPLDFPRYILSRYRPEYIVPSIVLLMSSGLNKTNLEDQTMLAEMIHFGKAYYFAEKILPHTADSILIGYSGEDLVNVAENQDVIWAHFIDNQLLYETSHFVKKKYMDERPKTLEIGNRCPGRIGEWLGWEIVKKYVAGSNLSLPEVMNTPDAQQIFTQSAYRPQVP